MDTQTRSLIVEDFFNEYVPVASCTNLEAEACSLHLHIVQMWKTWTYRHMDNDINGKPEQWTSICRKKGFVICHGRFCCPSLILGTISIWKWKSLNLSSKVCVYQNIGACLMSIHPSIMNTGWKIIRVSIWCFIPIISLSIDLFYLFHLQVSEQVCLIISIGTVLFILTQDQAEIHAICC